MGRLWDEEKTLNDAHALAREIGELLNDQPNRVVGTALILVMATWTQAQRDPELTAKRTLELILRMASEPPAIDPPRLPH